MLPNLGEASPEARNLHDWIRQNRFSNVKVSDKDWIFDAYSEIELYEAFTPDFQRFAFSSFETFALAGLERDKCSSMSWPLLKLYYSAFFAAHATTRATGHGQVNFTKEDVRSVNEFQAAVGSPEVMASGSYEVSVGEGNGTVFLRVSPASGASGVHEGFWKYFRSYLDALASEAVAQSLPSASMFLWEVSALSSCICESASSGVWFSSIRNAINYRHEFDCWKPNTKKSPPRKMDFPTKLSDTRSLEAGLGERADELKRLANLSLYLNSLNHENILHMSRELGGSSNFNRKWRSIRESVPHIS